LAPFRIPSLWSEKNPRARITPVINLVLHPRDIGTLLIGYAEGAVIFSFKQNTPTKFFYYEVPRGAPGGDSDPAALNVIRHPRLTQALWHPTGTFVLTAHEDGSLVFWDAVGKDARILMARTLTDTNIDRPGAAAFNPAGKTAPREQFLKIAWCANQDPDDTALLIAGGQPQDSPTKGLALFELGRTPMYNTSSWQILRGYFENPKRQRILPTPPNASVVDFCLIPRSSPHFCGAQDPIAIVAILSSGELISMSFPSGFPISPTNQLHVSMTFVHPFITTINLSPIERSKWLGMTENREKGPPVLQGGAEAPRAMKRFENRNIVQTAHADGTVRLWDAGHGDEIENQDVVQVDVGRAVGRPGGVDICAMSLSGASGEFAVGTRSGEVAVFRWGHNRNVGREQTPGPNSAGTLTDVTSRTDPALTDGLLPLTMLDMENGPVTALKLSDVGFVAVGFEGGRIAVIDLRGPAIIFNATAADFLKGDSRSGFGRRLSRSGNQQTKVEYATYIEFSVMTLEADPYSSILLHVGTNSGHLATFKILPEQSGRYHVDLAGAISLDDQVVCISPINADTGNAANASQEAVARLRQGGKVNGVLIVVTRSSARIFKPATNKGAHKTWDAGLCVSAAVTRFEDRGYALVGLFSDATARSYSIPALKEIGVALLNPPLDPGRLGEALVTSTGDVLGWTGPSEAALLNVWGTGLVINRSKDALFNPEAVIPPRPTISNLQWVSGTQYVTPADMDILIGGPDRPPSKRMIEQARADNAAVRKAGRVTSSAAGKDDEGYWDYAMRQMNERMERLGTMNDNVNKLEEASSGWAEDVSKFVDRQKRNLVVGGESHYTCITPNNAKVRILMLK